MVERACSWGGWGGGGLNPRRALCCTGPDASAGDTNATVSAGGFGRVRATFMAQGLWLRVGHD